jgi:hypothetical protein
MAAMMDRQIAKQEAHEKRMANAALTMFRAENSGRLVETFLGLAEKAIDDLCTAMWAQLRSGADTACITARMLIDCNDKGYYDTHGRLGVMNGLGIEDGCRLAEQGVQLAVGAYTDDQGPGSSGMTFLEAAMIRV